jgi:hypothetical protein
LQKAPLSGISQSAHDASTSSGSGSSGSGSSGSGSSGSGSSGSGSSGSGSSGSGVSAPTAGQALPQEVLDLFTGLSEEQFRLDLSSTQLRERAKK